MYHHSRFNVVVSTLYGDTLEHAESQEKNTYIFRLFIQLSLTRAEGHTVSFVSFLLFGSRMLQVCFYMLT